MKSVKMTIWVMVAVVLVGSLQQAKAGSAYAENDGAGFFDFNINTSDYGGKVAGGVQLESDEGYTGTIFLGCEPDINWNATVNSNDMTINFDNLSWTATGQDSSSIILSKWIPGGFGSEGYWEYTEPIPYDFSITYDYTSGISATSSISAIAPFNFYGHSYGNLSNGFVSGSLTVGTETVSFNYSSLSYYFIVPGGTFDDTDFPTSLTMNFGRPKLEVYASTLYTGQVGGYSTVVTPEPSTLLLFALGAVILRRRK